MPTGSDFPSAAARLFAMIGRQPTKSKSTEESLAIGASAGALLDMVGNTRKMDQPLPLPTSSKCNTRPHIGAQLYFTNHTLTGQRSKSPSNRTPQKVHVHSSVIHSAMAPAKSILSPIRCLTSLSHALGLVP